MWCENPADLFRLATFVQTDPGHEKEADAAYLFGHARVCETPILDAGADLHRECKVRLVAICKLAPGYPHNGTPDNPTYRDAPAWENELVDRGVNRKDIRMIESPRPAAGEEKFPVSHTGTEAERLVTLAKVSGWEAVFVVAHPMHMLRAFTQTVGFVLKEYPTLRVYAKTAAPKSWHAVALLNQGLTSGSPFMDGIDAEWKRLNAVYGNKYDPVPAAQVIEYINWRESSRWATTE